MRLRWCGAVSVLFSILCICPVKAEGVAAYLVRPAYDQNPAFTFYVPNAAEVFVVDDHESIQAVLLDKGSGIVITALNGPDVDGSNLAVFYSDGTGISSRTELNFSQIGVPMLLPPTIYSIPNINGQSGALGFVGKSYPGSLVILEIALSTNEKMTFKSLANTRGEWQISPPLLSPGRHQAKSYATFRDMKSGWTQDVSITILAPTDQFIHDLGAGTRQSIDKVIEGLPAPVRKMAQAVDTQSEFTSKYLFPTLFTLSAFVQSGVVAQNMLYLLFQALMMMGQFLGIIKKRQPIGLIYDAITKIPLGRAIVRLYDANTHQLIETDVTSASGVFSFMPKEGYYYLRVSKPGYAYPSQLVLTKRDGRFDHIYSGGDIHVTSGDAVISVAVPMDPEAYQEALGQRFKRLWQRWFEPINMWLMWFGFFLAILSYSRQSTRLNFVILWFYVGGLIYFWQSGRKIKREYGVVLNSSGRPLAGVELNLIDVEYNRLVSRRVSDNNGRYQFVAPPGRYQIKMVTPAYEMMTKVKMAYQGEELKVLGERGQSKHLIPKIIVKNAK